MVMIGKRFALGTVAAIGFIAASAPAYAQATRTWISGVGDDVNPCSRTAPCKTFQGALPKTAAGGEINCLDPGGFGGVTITKSITLLCDNTQSGVLVASTNGIIINGANAVVMISGLDLEGLGQTGSPGIHGITILNASVVRVVNTKIRGFRNGFGINAAPSTTPLALYIDNVSISEGGIGTNPATGGIGIFPTNAVGVNASIRNTAVTNNLNVGLRIDATASGGSAIAVKVDDSQINGNALACGDRIFAFPSRDMVKKSLKAPAQPGETGLWKRGSFIMAKISKRIALGTAAALGFVLASSPAAAQATRTWISGVGDDVNPCSRTAPCKTFAGAISKTATGGEINCIDPGGFGAVTITKSISLICDDVENGILVSSGNGITINNAAASVVLSGFDLEGLANNGSSASGSGVNIVNATSVQIRNSEIHGFKGYGINVAPSGSSVRLLIDNVTVSDNGTSGSPASGGISITPGTGFSVTGTIHNTRVYNNLNAGLKLDTTGTTATTITIKVDHSQIDGNAAVGLLVKAPVSTGVARLTLTDSSVSVNGTFGLFANGSGVTGRVGTTVITGNATGVNIANSATVNSYGTNQVNGNTTADGTFTAPNLPPL